MQKYDVVVVGGGIAGLTAAIYAAKAGKKTLVIEKQHRLGGRAVTNKKKGAYFNLGGHALYYGDAFKTFRELGLSLKGKKPSIEGYGIWQGKLNTMPLDVKSLFTTPLLSWKGKMELATWLVKLGKLDTHQYDRISLREWIEQNVKDPMVRNLFYALSRTASFVVSPDLIAAGPVLQQLKCSMKGVLYLDRGWGAIIDELWKKASEQEVHFYLKSKVTSIQHHNGSVQSVSCEDGMIIEAHQIIVTTSPVAAYQLVSGADKTALHLWKDQAIEITGACLDVALRRLPKPDQQFVYGIDRNVFLSNQSRAAYLSDNGAQVISLMKYQGNETDPEKDLQDLEQTLDLVQPGWRDELVAQQYLPKITVSYDLMHMKRSERPGPEVPEIKGLYVAGEWATHGELLVDAATASAKRAIKHILMDDRIEVERNEQYRNII
ncbi:dehydrogenase [Bacillus sp. MUM 116]|uniref:phytoene desaturase family protein n=1 Tax=Bacillus sp. MUM 116 TaxID=1678002 RepID=UPI0008F5BEAB|nr:FAD-dependent oxidoreductase [Bacillus sp. MUM 116]OIK08843.1 dehydrogenase [Bacillus sp. MUM 116]